MEKLVYSYTFTDNCTYSNQVFYPFEYKSKEKFLEDFIEELTTFNTDYFSDNDMQKFSLIYLFDLGYEVKDVINDDPFNNVYTLEEWFTKFKVK